MASDLEPRSPGTKPKAPAYRRGFWSSMIPFHPAAGLVRLPLCGTFNPRLRTKPLAASHRVKSDLRCWRTHRPGVRHGAARAADRRVPNLVKRPAQLIFDAGRLQDG